MGSLCLLTWKNWEFLTIFFHRLCPVQYWTKCSLRKRKFSLCYFGYNLAKLVLPQKVKHFRNIIVFINSYNAIVERVIIKLKVTHFSSNFQVTSFDSLNSSFSLYDTVPQLITSVSQIPTQNHSEEWSLWLFFGKGCCRRFNFRMTWQRSFFNRIVFWLSGMV